MQKIIILLGPPGCGKGTQSVFIKETLSIPHISTGELLRAEIAKSSELGLKAKALVESGQLVPEEMVISLLNQRITDDDCKEGFILDGFPRTIQQANTLSKELQAQPTVLYFHVDDNVIIERITGRLTCSKCKAVFHEKYSPPMKESICDKCGGELKKRKDDSKEVIMERLKNYHLQTAPLIEYYKKQGYLTEIAADDSVEAISKKLLQILTQ